MPYHNSLWNIICFILVQNHVVISRKDDDKFVGFDKSNTTSGYQNYFPHSKESSEKILKGIWLVLGIFLMIAKPARMRWSTKPKNADSGKSIAAEACELAVQF